MASIFKIDFYPHRWLVDTSQLPPEHRGNYIQILMMIYAKEKPIDNDAKWLSGSCGCSSRMVASSITYLVDKEFLILIENGSKITQKRAELELNTKRTYLESCANGARMTNEKKSEYKKNKELVYAQRSEKFTLTTPTPTPTPTPTKEVKAQTLFDDDLPPKGIPSDLWKDFLDLRKKKKTPNTARAIQLLLRKLDELSLDSEKRIQIIEQSIMRGWISFFPLAIDKSLNLGQGKKLSYREEKDLQQQQWIEEARIKYEQEHPE